MRDIFRFRVLRFLAILSILLPVGVPPVSGSARTAPARPVRAKVPPVRLGPAEDLTLLAGSAVVNVGNTRIGGDVSVSPGDTVSGFPPGQVRGTIDVDNPEARAEKAAAVAAYQDAAGRTPTAVVPPQLGGTTVPSGVYATPGRVFEIAGTLTLDGAGDPDATFIFQAVELNTARVSNIDLINGAQAKNVIWQVGNQAALGRYSTFRGNLLARHAVSVETGTFVDGRVMALDDVLNITGTDGQPPTNVIWPRNRQTATSVTSSVNPSYKGEAVTFTAVVTGNYRGFAPTNEVLFLDGDVVIGSAMIDRTGRAVFTTSDLTRGGHGITAVYVDGGTAANEAWVDFAPSRSEVITQVVLNRREAG